MLNNEPKRVTVFSKNDVFMTSRTYWGVWLATLCRLLVFRANPETRARLQRPGQREFVYLHLALDWIGAAFFVLSGSIWVALFGRAICYAAVLFVYQLMTKRRFRGGTSVASALTKD